MLGCHSESANALVEKWRLGLASARGFQAEGQVRHTICDRAFSENPDQFDPTAVSNASGEA